jgi:hypothetical protein
MIFETDELLGLEKKVVFSDDGLIACGQFDRDANQVNGFEWQLKEDGTYDKFAVEYVKFDKD